MGLGSRIRKKPIPDPGVKKAPDPGVKKAPDPDPQHCILVAGFCNTMRQRYDSESGRI
jgi:hypothetical protein